jgi:hypothetical protein
VVQHTGFLFVKGSLGENSWGALTERDLMTLYDIRTEMAIIRNLKKSDVEDARERWKALKDRVDLFIKDQRLPAMWSKYLLEELGKI